MKDLSIVLQLLSCAVFLAILFAVPTTSAATMRADLTHVDSGRGFTKLELLRRMAARSTARAARLHGRSLAVTAPVAHGVNDFFSEYNIRLGIGTPSPQPVVLSLDTGSDLVWTQCACLVCFDQPLPVFKPSASTAFRAMSCSDPLCAGGGLVMSGCTGKRNVCFYVYSYADNSVTMGTIALDTFTFGDSMVVPNLHFGCGLFNNLEPIFNASGVAGFGRGPLSLPSQLRVSSFSYCFTTIAEGRSSPVFLGTPDDLGAHAVGPIKSTPFIPNPAVAPVFYYLSLIGITVGKTRLPFSASTFALRDNGSGGTIIDSGTPVTSFPPAVFRSLYQAFVSQVPLPVANTSTAEGLLCFSTSDDPPVVAVPKLTLHLEGADWELPRENYVLDFHDDGGLMCVVLGSSGGSTTVIGNFQQQNMHVLYDLAANRMVFLPALCDKLQ